MSQATTYLDLDVTHDGHVATVEIRRPPNNFFGTALIRAIADAFEDLDGQVTCRGIVLASTGKAFCAGRICRNRERCEMKPHHSLRCRIFIRKPQDFSAPASLWLPRSTARRSAAA